MPLSITNPPGSARARGTGVTAVLGPTNTGKTHLAIERMLAHSSGLIGLPLRLLAREVYNKVVAAAGVDSVALITGEEKIKPPNPRFWVSTVEAMPRDLDVAFLAIDEIQLGADFERGHIFTDRVLNRRGREETIILGAATMKGLVARLLPGANVISRPRLSQLTYSGDKKLTRLPRRSAIVAFSAEEVYAIAELIRRQRGGAAVVLGALSPRTRNAQVALYQAGDVDYLVATDAIGMGLNLEVDHVAFAADRKFDGYQYRKLSPAELAQIAGRAGRATRDGTFGTTGRCPPFDQELVQALESHAFEPVRVLQWRNAQLDFSSIGALQASLSAAPAQEGLTRAPVAEDILVLDHASREEAVRSVATTSSAVERLWDVCQVPDYRKVSPAAHAELVVALYGFLTRQGNIPVDWFFRQITQTDRTDGDIDTLSARIAHIRTWTFVANRPDWLEDPGHWQGVTRAIEDKLSDALHERLAERFVDRRTSVLMRRLRENAMLETEISKSGDVVVEGHAIGRLEGFHFIADPSAGGPEAKALRNAANKALAGEIEQRAARLSSAANDQFVLAADGTLRWHGDAVAKLVAGDDALRPRVRLLADEQLTGSARETVQTRVDIWIKAHVEKLLGPLVQLMHAEDISGIARGVAYQLVEALGVLERQKVAEEVKILDQESRAKLRKYGVRFGAYHIYLPILLKPAARSLAVQLWGLAHGAPEIKGLDELPHLAAAGRTSIPVDKAIPRALYRTVGYRVCGERAVRVDILERLADLIRPALAWRPNAPGEKPAGAVDGSSFAVTGAMTSLTGSSGEDFASILRSLGYRMERRPRPAEPEPAAAPQGPTVAEAEANAAQEGREPESPSIAADAEPALAAGQLGVSDQDSPHPEPAPADSPKENAVESDQSGSEALAAVGEDAASKASAAASAPPPDGAASDMIEVWRPARADERRRWRSHGPQQARAKQRPEQAAAGSGTAQPSGGEEARGRRQAEAKGARQGEGGRPARELRPARNDGEGRPEHRGKPPRREARTWQAKEARRDKPIDPDSPFAKLAALKEQLESHAKRRP